jgi:hypothetical protein
MPESGIMLAPSYPKFRVDESTSIGVLLVSPNSKLRREMRQKLHQDRWNLTEAFGAFQNRPMHAKQNQSTPLGIKIGT